MTTEHTIQTNKDLVKRFIEHGYAKAMAGDQQVIHEYLHDHFKDHTPQIHDADHRGVEGMKAATAMMAAAAPNTRSRADMLIAEGNMVVAHWTATGTHTGKHQHRHHDAHVQPSGEDFTISGVSIFRVIDGKISELWNYDNHLDYMIEVGILGPTGGATSNA